MAIETMTVETIDDGDLVREINDSILRIGKDVMSRKLQPGKRTVTVKIEIEPDVDPGNEMNFPKYCWSVNSSLPGRKSKSSNALIEEGEIKVNTNERKNPLQINIADLNQN